MDVDTWIDTFKGDYRVAELSDRDRGMLDFAVELTLRPGAIESADLERLRLLGFDDAAITDIVQVTALFAYYNRLADGLGVKSEPPLQD